MAFFARLFGWLRRRPQQPVYGEAEAYARCHGERARATEVIVSPKPPAPRTLPRLAGDYLQRCFEERLERRASGHRVKRPLGPVAVEGGGVGPEDERSRSGAWTRIHGELLRREAVAAAGGCGDDDAVETLDLPEPLERVGRATGRDSMRASTDTPARSAACSTASSSGIATATCVLHRRVEPELQRHDDQVGGHERRLLGPRDADRGVEHDRVELAAGEGHEHAAAVPACARGLAPARSRRARSRRVRPRASSRSRHADVDAGQLADHPRERGSRAKISRRRDSSGVPTKT